MDVVPTDPRRVPVWARSVHLEERGKERHRSAGSVGGGVEYRKDIDGLRAIAVLLVLFFHFNLVDFGSGGFMGVDIFFVISGYLISKIIWADLDRERFSFRTFYTRRIRRLAPALIITQIIVLFFAYLVLMPSEVISLAKEVIAAQFYVSNIYYWRSLNYFALHSDHSFMLHTWSLAVEEQFYLIFPTFLVFIHRWKPQAFAICLIAVMILSFAVNLALMAYKPEADFYLLPTRAWQFAVGALVGVLPLQNFKSEERWWISILAFIAGTSLIVFALVLFRPERPYPGVFALLPTFGAAMLILSGEEPNSLSRRVLGQRTLVAIGRISYSLYLVHWPIRVFATTLLIDYSLPWRWASFGLSFVLAGIMYVVVEQPLRIGLRLPPKRTLAAYLAATAAITLLGGSAVASEGWTFRYTPAEVRLAAAADDVDQVSIACEGDKTSSPGGLCRIGSPGLQPAWLLFGDSHAAALRQSFSTWLSQNRQAGFFAFTSACLPVPDSGSSACRSFNRSISRFLREQPNIQTVILASTWREPLERGFVDRNGRTVSGPAAIAAFESSLNERLTELAAMHRRIVVWEPVPGAKLPVPGTLARDQALGWNRDIRFTRSDYEATYSFLLRALDQNSTRLSARIRPSASLCSSGFCSIMDDGRPLYSDNAHPAHSQAPFFARIIAKDLNELTPTNCSRSELLQANSDRTLGIGCRRANPSR